MSMPLRTLMLILVLSASIGEAREASLQETPISITAMSREELTSSGLTDPVELINNFGVMPFRGGPAGQPGTASIRIRGVGHQPAQNAYTRTGVYIDGVYMGPTSDLERVEVLRGPQGTLFGRNALGGVVAPTIRGDRSTYAPEFESFTADASGSSDAGYVDYTYAIPQDGPGAINPFVDVDFARGLLAGDTAFATDHYYKWEEAYADVTFDDLYFIQKDLRKTTPPLSWSSFYWANESNKQVVKKEADYPNDPLYPKKGRTGKPGKAKKTFGALLRMVGSPVELDKDGASAQWGLPETGFKRRGSGTSAWDIAAGARENVVVAVIDSGLDTTHIDGPQYLWTNVDEIAGNGVDDDNNGYVDDVHGWNFYSETNDITDDNGHGTFVAGIIAAKTNNGEGIAGINPGARIMPLKVLNGVGKSRILAVYRAIRYAVDNGARVINLSVGGKGITRLEQIGINYAYAMGCMVVVAAGNEGADVAGHGPPGARRAFSVAAMDMDGKPRKSSNRGMNVAVTAPGHSIYSLTARKGNRDGKFLPKVSGKYFRANGTSFSAPFVTGTASLIWSKYPDLSNRMVEDMILQSAKDIHDPGRDAHTGNGLLDGLGALTQSPADLLVPRITEVYVNKEKRRIASVDLYGVIRGNLDHYTVSVGRGKKPGKWKTVSGPVTQPVDYRLISRIDGAHFSKGSQWMVKIDAVDKRKKTRSVKVLISKDKG